MPQRNTFLLTLFSLILSVSVGMPGTPAFSAVGNHFETNRNSKIMGVATNPSYVQELRGFCNAFAFNAGTPSNISAIKTALTSNAGVLLPIIGISDVIQDPKTGLLRSDYTALTKKIAQTAAQHHKGPVLFYLDEPMWRVREGCEKNKAATSCSEIKRGYSKMLTQLRNVAATLRSIIPHSGLGHIEAYAELKKQKTAWGRVILADDAEYLGFDCYGDVNSCGGHPQIDYLFWVTQALNIMEKSSAIGRKIIFVPGTFQSLKTFPQESLAINQLNAYMSHMDTSSLFAGSIAFIWPSFDTGTKNTAFIGARSNSLLRNALVNAHRARIIPPASLFLPAALTLVAANPVNQSSATSQLNISKAGYAHIYLQSAGMKSCTVKMGSKQYPATPNTLQYWKSPYIQSSLNVVATCTDYRGKSISQSTLIKVSP